MYRILIVEDNKSIRNDLKSFLTNEGFNVQSASNGEQAYVLAVNECPNLIITDIHMPVMNGLGLMKKIKANPDTTDIPVIFLTADRDACERINKSADMNQVCITKPYIFEDILEIIRLNSGLKTQTTTNKEDEKFN